MNLNGSYVYLNRNCDAKPTVPAVSLRVGPLAEVSGPRLMGPIFEPVHAVWYFWDGPRSGVAASSGQPHAFESIFDESADDWTDEFALRSIDDQTLDRFIAALRRVADDQAMNWERSADGSWRPLTLNAATQSQELLEMAKVVWESIRPDVQLGLRMRGRFTGPWPCGPFEVCWTSVGEP